MPAFKPTFFTALRRAVLHAPTEHALGGAGEVSGGVSGFGGFHFNEHLKQAPACAVVAFTGVQALALEVHVIYHGEVPGGALAERCDVLLNVAAGGSGGLAELWRGFVQTMNNEERLLANGAGEELAEVALLLAFMVFQERGAAGPGTMLFSQQPFGKRDTTLLEPRDEFRETLFKRAFPPFHIPDEMTDAERGEVLSGVPTRQPVHGAVAFILPNALPDAVEVAATQC